MFVLENVSYFSDLTASLFYIVCNSKPAKQEINLSEFQISH